MHLDAVIAALQEELDGLNPNDSNYAERKAAIEAEIENIDSLPRPETDPAKPDVSIDPDQEYLAGLKEELANSEPGRKAEIQTEIDRVEQARSAPVPDAKEATVDEKPSEEEIEQRKQARAGRKGKVEQARSAPVPGQTAPGKDK